MMGWFKRRSPDAPRSEPPMPPQPSAARDWGAGDVARCISNDPWMEHPSGLQRPGPARGQVARVVHVRAAYGTVWLALRGWRGYFSAGYFRKLRPCTTDFREQLKERQPVPAKAAPALPDLEPVA